MISEELVNAIYNAIPTEYTIEVYDTKTGGIPIEVGKRRARQFYIFKGEEATIPEEIEYPCIIFDVITPRMPDAQRPVNRLLSRENHGEHDVKDVKGERPLASLSFDIRAKLDTFSGVKLLPEEIANQVTKALVLWCHQGFRDVLKEYNAVLRSVENINSVDDLIDVDWVRGRQFDVMIQYILSWDEIRTEIETIEEPQVTIEQ